MRSGPVSFVLAGAVQRDTQMLSEQRSIRQSCQSVVKSSVTKMLTTLFQLLAGALELFDVTIELRDVMLRLFSTHLFSFSPRVFGLSAIAFGLLGLCCCGTDVFEILVVSEVDDRDDGQGRKHGIETHAAFKVNNAARYKSADEIGERRPQIMLGPRIPQWAS